MMKFFPHNGESSSSAASVFSGKVVLMSTVSTGNAGQLALDVILNTQLNNSGLQREGTLESEHLLPVTGLEQFGSPIMTAAKSYHDHFLVMPLEVYSSRSIVYIQQRSTHLPNKQQQFATALVGFLKSSSASGLVILTGAKLSPLFEASLKCNKLFHTTASTSLKSMFPELDVLLAMTQEIPSKHLESVEGMPLSKCIYDMACHECFAMGVLLLGRFCSDGNNVHDGIVLASSVSDAMNLTEKEYFSDYSNVARPMSWRTLAGADLQLEQDRVGNSIYY